MADTLQIASWVVISLIAFIACGGRTHHEIELPDASNQDASDPDEPALRCRNGEVEESTRKDERGEPVEWRLAYQCTRGCRLDLAEYSGGRTPNQLCEEARYGGPCEFIEHFRCIDGVVEYPRAPCETGEWARALTCAGGCRLDLDEMDLWNLWYPQEMCNASSGGDAGKR